MIAKKPKLDLAGVLLGAGHMIEVAPRSGNEMSYSEAFLYCRFLEYNGHRGWRLPTAEEWWRYALPGWYLDRGLMFDDAPVNYVMPVRDI